jgi:hypothetical protein
MPNPPFWGVLVELFVPLLIFVMLSIVGGRIATSSAGTEVEGNKACETENSCLS